MKAAVGTQLHLFEDRVLFLDGLEAILTVFDHRFQAVLLRARSNGLGSDDNYSCICGRDALVVLNHLV